MSILKSIETARSVGASDDDILNEIIKQNPAKKQIFETARQRGANSSDIVREVVRQNQTNSSMTNEFKKMSSEQVELQPEKKSLLNKIGKFFTGSTQKFADTLGAAASVIDPKTKKLRQEVISDTNKQVDSYLEMAKKETDKDKKDKLLKAASYLADTEDIDIYNRPEYQKTAKQIYGEGIGVAAETLGWGRVGTIAKTTKAVSVGQNVLRAAKTGGVLGGVTSASSSMQQDKDWGDVAKDTAIGTATGAATGAALGYVSSKIAGKITDKKATKLASQPLNKKAKIKAYKSGQIKEAGLFKGEKRLYTAKEKELGKLAQEVGITKGGQKDIIKVNKAISSEATTLKQKLKDSGAIYNKNNVKGILNKMKTEKTVDLIDPEVRVYDKMVKKFNKMVDSKQNKGLDGLLELRQDFDAWAKSNTPTIFERKTGGAYRALISVRDSVNDYLNKVVKDDVVKLSLKKQTDLFRLLDNLAESAVSSPKLKSSLVGKGAKKILPWAVGGGLASAGIKSIGNKSSSTTYYPSGQ